MPKMSTMQISMRLPLLPIPLPMLLQIMQVLMPTMTTARLTTTNKCAEATKFDVYSQNKMYRGKKIVHRRAQCIARIFLASARKIRALSVGFFVGSKIAPNPPLKTKIARQAAEQNRTCKVKMNSGELSVPRGRSELRRLVSLWAVKWHLLPTIKTKIAQQTAEQNSTVLQK